MAIDTRQEIDDFLDYYFSKLNIIDIHLPVELQKPQTAVEFERRFNYIYVDQVEKINQMVCSLLNRNLADQENRIVSERLRVFLKNFGF